MIKILKEAANSNGVYSLLHGWVKRPVKDDIPDKVELEPELSDLVDKSKSCNTVEGIDKYIDDLYILRQQGLISGGEYSKENQLFKEIRNKGILDNLREKRVELENQEMSLEEALTDDQYADLVGLLDGMLDDQPEDNFKWYYGIALHNDTDDDTWVLMSENKSNLDHNTLSKYLKAFKGSEEEFEEFYDTYNNDSRYIIDHYDSGEFSASIVIDDDEDYRKWEEIQVTDIPNCKVVYKNRPVEFVYEEHVRV